MRVELARLPLALAGDPPLPLPPPADKLRFLVALGEAVGLLGRVGVRTLILEDLQHADPASLEAVLYLVQRTLSPHPDPFPHLLGTFRVGELPSWALAMLQHLVEAGLILKIALEPLSPQGVEQLLKNLDLSGLDPLRLAPPLARHTEGNPLFLLETLRVLWQQGRLATPPEHLPIPPRVEAIVARRLASLSPVALGLAQVAAVAGEGFSLELAARVLAEDPLDLAGPWAELEAARILRGDRLASGLLEEVLRQGLPAVIRAHLAHRVALVLGE